MAGRDRKSQGLVGQVLHNTYRLERLLGHGGMGEVYEASHVSLTVRFAVKVLDHTLATDKEAIARFRREAEITARLGHPNIVEVSDFHHSGEHLFMVMELLEGEDLANRLARVGPLPLHQVASIFMQTASALAAAHRHGVIHRDLKPPNIFLCRRGVRDDFVKVVDFGVSKLLDAETTLTRADAIVGSPQYMAPEQVEGSAEVDSRADIYSLATIVYEMISGRRAITAHSVPSLLFKVVYGDLTPLSELRPDLPAPVAAVIHKALHKQRSERFESMVAFWDAFAQAMRAEGLSVAEDRQLWRDAPPDGKTEVAISLPPPRAETGPSARPAARGSIEDTTLSGSAGEFERRGARRRLYLVALSVVLIALSGLALLVTLSVPAPRPKPAGTPAPVKALPDVGATLRAPTSGGLPAEPPAAPAGPDAEAFAARPDAGRSGPAVVVAPPVHKSRLPPSRSAKRVKLCINADVLSDVWVNGRSVGQTLSCLDVPAGTYQVTVRNAVHGLQTRRVTVRRKMTSVYFGPP